MPERIEDLVEDKQLLISRILKNIIIPQIKADNGIHWTYDDIMVGVRNENTTKQHISIRDVKNVMTYLIDKYDLETRLINGRLYIYFKS